MNDEQRSMALFQAQPEGPVLIFHPAALSLAYVAQPHRTRATSCASLGMLDKK